MPRLILLLTALLAMSCPATAQPRVFRWQDDTGAVHITSHIDKIPEKYRASAAAMSLQTVTGAGEEKTAAPGEIIGGENGAGFDPSGGKIAVEAVFDGKIARRAWIDTGSGRVTITTKLAAALGYDHKRARKSRFRVPGGSITAPVVTLAKVRIGGAEAGNVEAVVMDFDGRGPVSAVIGMNFLSRFAFEIDMAASVITFSPLAGEK